MLFEKKLLNTKTAFFALLLMSFLSHHFFREMSSLFSIFRKLCQFLPKTFQSCLHPNITKLLWCVHDKIGVKRAPESRLNVAILMGFIVTILPIWERQGCHAWRERRQYPDSKATCFKNEFFQDSFFFAMLWETNEFVKSFLKGSFFEFNLFYVLCLLLSAF